MKNEYLLVGAAESDITPVKGIQIAGDIGRYRPVEEIRDPLFAKVLIIEQGKKRVCWISLDILAISTKWADEIKKQAAARYGLNPETIMVHSVQNHAAPAVGHFFVFDEDDQGVFPEEYPWLLGGDPRYNSGFVEGVLQAIGKALASLQPATVKIGRGVDGRVAFNRRFVMRDGSGRTHPGQCNPDVLYCEGPTDPEVGVMTFTAKNGKTIAALLHHTCHPVHGYPERWISAGWPGAWCNGVRELLGGKCVTMLVNGFCGNIHQCNHLDPHYKDDYVDMGRKLTETAANVLKNMKQMESPVLDWSTKSIRIPMRSPTDKQVKDARQLLKKHPQPMWLDATKTAVSWDWVYAAMRVDLVKHVKKTPIFHYPIQTFRLGNMALLAVPGEPFVEEQLRIKLASPAEFTFTAHMSNTYVGYLPTVQAFERGGYETNTSIGSKLTEKALSMVGDASIGMLNKLFKQ